MKIAKVTITERFSCREDNRHTIVQGVFEPQTKRRRLTIPDRPKLGIELDADCPARFAALQIR